MGITAHDKQPDNNSAKQLRSAAEQGSGNNAAKAFGAVDPTAQLQEEDEMVKSLKADPTAQLNPEEEMLKK
jgi:hypothetical protein